MTDFPTKDILVECIMCETNGTPHDPIIWLGSVPWHLSCMMTVIASNGDPHLVCRCSICRSQDRLPPPDPDDDWMPVGLGARRPPGQP
jgi:hypothetical protein